VWQWWKLWRQERAWRVEEQRRRDFCPACQHPWSSHGTPEGCKDCDYDIIHRHDDALSVPCSRQPPAGDDLDGARPAWTSSSRRLRELLSQEQRRVHLDERGVLMSVGQASVGRRMGTVLSSDLPDLAARWLAMGLDTAALRELAGHPRYDAFGIDMLWRQVLDEVPDSSAHGDTGGAEADEELDWVQLLPVELARWRLGEATSEEVTGRLLALQETTQISVVAGMGELFMVEEMRFAPSSQPSDSDRERDTILAELAADVIF